MKTKKIIYVTGSRAEYGVMKELLLKMRASGKFNLSLIVTGMHFSKKHGFTLEDIKKDKFRIAAKVNMHVEDSSLAGMAKSVGYGILGITGAFLRERPDLVMVTGDRGELLAAAIAASHLNIPVAHISGGDMTTGATIDERVRHAITKFSTLHFAESKKSAKNLVRMGENKKFVFAVGNHGARPRRRADAPNYGGFKKIADAIRAYISQFRFRQQTNHRGYKKISKIIVSPRF